MSARRRARKATGWRRWMSLKSTTKKRLATAARADLGNMPEVSEMEIIRHFTRLSTWNYAIDLGMYPLGSCTMKYNARVNEVVARFPGLANAHPLPAGGSFTGRDARDEDAL